MRYLFYITTIGVLLIGLLMIGCSQSRTSTEQVAIQPADHQAMIEIDGMACPFCVYNVQRQLKEIEGVLQVDVSIEKGEAYITLSKQNPPTAEQLRAAVKSAGFTPRRVHMP